MSNDGDKEAGHSPATEGSARTRLARRLVDELRHRADLALFADAAPSRWTDALLAETRFHLAGTMNAMEMAIKLEITDPGIEARLSGLGQPYSSIALERQVDLLSPELLSHYRLRGALTVVLRERPDPALFDATGDLMARAGDRPFAQMLAALSLAEQRWCGPLLLDALMRADLPAEHFHDLAWTTAALLIRGISQVEESTDRVVLHAVIQAVERVIARHDEGGGPFALAQRCARALSEEERVRFAPAALVERRLLLFCALAEAETTLAIEVVLGALLDGGNEARHALLRLMRIEEALAVHVYEMLAPLTGGSGTDAAIADFVERYRAYDSARAEGWLAGMMLPPALVAKLTILDPSA